MKVAFVIPTLFGGGAEKVMRSIASALARDNDLAVDIILLVDDPSIKEYEGCKVYSIAASRVVFSYIALKRHIRSNRYDAVITTLPHVIRLVSLISLLSITSRFFHVARLANTYSLDTARASIFTRLQNALIDLGVNKYIAVSEGVAVDFVDYASVSPSKISVINNPVDVVADFKYREVANRIKIVAAGRLVAQKNFKCLIEAISIVGREEVTLDIFGEGPEEANLKDCIEQLGLAGRVHLKGFASDFGSKLIEYDLLVLSSNFEGLPNVILEALASGLPVVSTNCPNGPHEILSPHDYLGMLAKVGDPESLACSICDFLNSGFMSEEYAVKRRGYIKENYSSTVIVEKYRSALRGSVLSR